MNISLSISTMLTNCTKVQWVFRTCCYKYHTQLSSVEIRKERAR